MHLHSTISLLHLAFDVFYFLKCAFGIATAQTGEAMHSGVCEMVQLMHATSATTWFYCQPLANDSGLLKAFDTTLGVRSKHPHVVSVNLAFNLAAAGDDTAQDGGSTRAAGGPMLSGAGDTAAHIHGATYARKQASMWLLESSQWRQNTDVVEDWTDSEVLALPH